ncbi:uncharacterized protein LOC107868912 [Capsicum annuum]|uniref:uncharacterized protein LOC107868912 n=1 Tax=Capsicum annuum TaxID=4072 RepID=UPI0007BF34E5|nr:uncharacterized protein LOC107868912 [Capsicum annuum]
MVPLKRLTPRRGPAKIVAPPNLNEGKSTSTIFQKEFRRNDGFLRKEDISNCLNGNNYCYKCRKPGHFIKDCLLHKLKYKDYIKNNPRKAMKKDLVPNEFKKTNGEVAETSMIMIEVIDSLFSLMAKSNDKDEDDEEKSLFDIQTNL